MNFQWFLCFISAYMQCEHCVDEKFTVRGDGFYHGSLT